MKQIKKTLCMVMVSFGILIASCGNDSSSNEEVGDSVKTDDSTLLNASDNNYPNNRIHMKDSSSGTDSVSNDSIRK